MQTIYIVVLWWIDLINTLIKKRTTTLQNEKNGTRFISHYEPGTVRSNISIYMPKPTNGLNYDIKARSIRVDV